MSQQVGASVQRTKNRMDYARATSGLRTPRVQLGSKASGGAKLGENSRVVATQPKFNPATGKMERVYLTELGNEYTSRAEADMEQNEIDEAVQQQLYPGYNDYNDKQAVAAQAPATAVAAQLWKEAQKAYDAERNANAKEVYGGNPWLRGGREMHVVDGATNSGKNEESRLKHFDLQKMSDNAWARVGKQMTASCYARLRKMYPNALERQVQASAEKEARALVQNAVYKYAVKMNAPKSQLDFFMRKAVDANLLTSVFRGLARYGAGTTGDMAAYEAANEEYGKSHRWTGVFGTATGMAFDPTNWVGVYVGSLGGRAALNIGGRFVLGSAPGVGARLFGSTMAGRLATGAASGMGMMGTYEGVKEAERQWVYGGHVNPETRENEGYSAGAVALSALKGAGLGAMTGMVSPLVGNVADKVVQTTTSATGKVATRLGEVATSAVAEGTIFAMPAVISGQESFVDAWTESMAMIVGFKGQHMVKSAGQVIAGMRPVANPRTMEERNKNRRGFAENLKRTMDAGANKQWNGNQPDVRFTKEELAELKQMGYGNLASLLTPTEKVLPKKKPGQPKHPKNTDGLTVYFDVGSGKKEAEADPKMKWLQQHPEFDGYATMEKLMQDPNVSQAARAKAYYMLTGRQLPMGTITGWNVGKDDKGNIWVKSVTSEGEVVTSRRFRDEASAKREEAKIIRQVELNTVDMGEQYKEMQANAAVVETAIKAVAPNADVNEAMRVYGEVKKGNKDYDSYKDLAKSIDEAIASNPEAVERAKTLLPENIRKDIAEQTGVEVDKALGKPEAERTDAEKQAVQTYLERLYDKSASDDAVTPPDAQLQGPEQFAEAYAKHRTHKGSGQVVPATMKAGDRKVYVIDGDVVQYADKSGIDVAKSDKSIVVCDAETGKYEYTSPDQLMNVGEPADPSTLSEAYMANERAKEAAANGEGTAEGNAAAESNAAANGDVSADGGKAEVVEPAYTDGSRVEINGHEYDVKSAGEKTVALVDEHGKELAWTRSALDAKLESGDAEVLEPKAEAAPDVATEGLKAGDVFEDSDGNALTVKRVDGDKVVAVGADGKEQTYEDGMFEQMVESGVLKRAQKTEEPSEAKVDLTDNQGNPTPQSDLSSESKGAEQSSGVQAEVPQVDVQENAPMPMRVVGKGKNAVQEEDWLATTPKRGHDYVFKESGLDAEEANAFVENKVAEAEKNLEKVKGKAPKMGTNIAAYKEAKADYEARVAEAQKAVDYWHAVKAERDKVLLEERRARKEKDKALYDDAVAQEEQRKAEMAQKAAEQEALGSNAVAPAIKEKWENAPKVDGGADEITLPNGEVVTGHYVLTESGAVSASHQATNGFAETEGYPVDVNGETVNDRDYKRDAEAQQVTRGMAADYDSRALQSPVVVSGDGVVLSGNGRTMAGEIAALNGSDAKYNAYLRGHAGKFGFTAEQVEGFKHPRVVFVPDGEMPYTSETFAKFNQREQKSQSRTEMAVKLGKVVDDALFGRVMDVIGRHESLAEFYADDAATASVVKELADAGVIPQTEMAQLFDGGRLSESGQAMVEGVLVGKVFQGSPDAVRQITEVKSMRKAVMAALPEVVACHRLGGGYDLSKELAAAVDLVYKARKAGFKLGQHVSQHARQGNLFQLDDGATVADYNNAAVMMLADVMNDGRVTQLKKVLSFYNTQAADSAQGIGDMFAGGVKSKGQIINEVNELLNNGQEYDRRTPSVADGQGVGGEGGEQGDVAGPSHQGGEGSERGLSEAFDGLAAQLKTAEGGERKRVLGEMRDGIARFAEENGYPVPEFLLTREDFLAAVPEKDRAKYVEWLDDGAHMPAYYTKGKVYVYVEGCETFDKDVNETLAHEYTHADNAEFPENVNALTYALEDTHEVTRDELREILREMSQGEHYDREAERLEAEGKDVNKMLADEVIAHAVARMVRDGEQVLDGITKNPTLQFIIKRAYKVRENERQYNIRARENAERHDNASEGDNRGGSNNGANVEGESANGGVGRPVNGSEGGEVSSERGRSTVSDGKEVAAPSSEGAKVGVTDGEKSSATGDVVPSGKGKTDNPRQQKAVGKSAQPPTREESILRDVVIEHMKGSGLDVIGTEDGQRVLDMVNEDGAKEHRVYHGSGAEFDHFDHSHMGEGEGAQAYGWGTYVTEVRGIGEGYAIRSKNGIAMSREEWSLKRSELESNIYRAKEQLPFLKGEYKAEVEAQISEWEEQLKDYEPHNNLYTVEIPDDNGGNYLDWNGHPAKSLLKDVGSFLESNGFERVQDSPARYERGESTVVLNPNATGADLYAELQEALGSDKKASLALAELGYAGIKYPAEFRSGGRKDGAKNYVIFNENDAEITDHVRFFKTKNGEAYGFTVGGKIYYDPRIANAETPVHEYAHLWASALKANNAEEWKNVVDLMKGTNVWEEVKKAYPELETDDEIADEVLATYSGRRGAERLREEMRKAAAEGDGVMGKAEAVSALQRVKRAIDKFWKAVADFLHIHYTSAEEVADRVMKDLLDGVDPRSMMDGGKSLRPETRVNVVEAEAGHGFKNYAEAKTWAKEHIARTYSGEETGGKGDIRISNAAVDKYLSQSAVDKSESKDVHLAVLKVLPDVIRESVDAEQHADFKKGEDGVRSAANGVNPNVTIHRLYGAVRMDGKVYRVKVTLKEDTQNEKLAKKAYSYEATKIELLAGTLVKPEDDDPNTNNSITAANLLNGVEKSYDGGKFFEDYNKIREQFIGEKGAAAADHADEVNTRLDNLSVAREMEADKKDAKAIKMATGWERGADGKWRYEIPDMKEFDRNGNLLYRKNHPDYARYIELLDKEDANLFEDGEALTVEERAEFETLSKKYESDKFGGEKLDNNHRLEAYVDAPELFKAYPELKNVGLRFEDTGGNEIASYHLISSVFDFDGEDFGDIVVNTGKVSAYTPTKELKSCILHEMQHAIQWIEGFARGGNPKSMQRRFEAAKEEWRARAWADALRDKADEMGEHYNQAAVEKALIEEYKEMGMDNDEWMPNKEIRMKGFNYFARVYSDRSKDSDIKNFRLAESTRADFNPYVEYTKLGGEVESRNVEARMGMTAEERRASLAAETEDVSREDQIFLTGGDGGRSYSLKDGSFLRSGSYFSGGGLLEEGLKDYLDPKVAVEFNEKISGVYRDNFGNHIVTADVRDVDPKKLVKDIDGPVQYFHASPVCKNFSTAKRDGGEVELDKETARSTAQFIGETRPKVVTIENVKGYKNSDALKIITDELTAQGYDWDMGVYNAADYGGYTNRERLIVRAVRDGKLPPKPEALPEGERKGGWIEAVADLMEGLPEKKSGVPKWVDERLKGEGIDYRHIDKPLYVFGQGNSRTSIPHAFADELLPTLRTKGGDMIIMPDGRVLKVTPRVLARVTGLADDYEMPATDDLAHTVVGNGIPTQLSEHVIGPLLADVFNGGEPARKDGSAHLGRGNGAGEKGAAEDYTAFASRYGVSADMVKDYALGMETGNLQKANFALAEIRRTMRVANRGMKLSEFGKLFRPVQKELAERYGDIEVLRQEYIDAEMRERGVMEAARKRAEEEAAKRKARADELRLLPAEELDRRYFEAVERGDDAAAREMLDEAARRKGYDDTESEYQGVGAWVAPSNPGYESDAARRADVEDNAPDVNVEDIALGYSLVDENYWHEPRKYMQTDATAVESVNAINDAMAAIRRGEKDVKVKVYRAVPSSVKEGKLRNGDWVTPSRAYAKMHGENRLEGDYRIIEDEVPVNELWWDGNDSREWGFDDGKGYKYKNVENSRKLNDLVTRDDNGEIIAPSKRFDENVEDVRYRTSEELGQEYGSRWIDEQTNEDGRHTTQVKNTLNSYKKFGDWVMRDSGGKKVDVLDASSGLGLGTEWLRKNGIDAEDVEPYPSENRTAPTYRNYDEVGKKYDYIISNAVLNVIPDDWRANVLHNMADKLKVGGKLVVNVRSAESIRKQGKEGETRITLDDPSEILVLRPNGSIKAYQKGFTKAELKEWCEKELGKGYSVEIANDKNAGGSYDTAVVVTKNNESGTIGVASEAGRPRRSAQAVPNSGAKLSMVQELTNKIEKLSEDISEKGEMGAHEFLFNVAKAFGLEGNNLNKSFYKDLGNSIGIRISDHYANADNITKKNSNDEVYGLVVKLSPQRFKSRSDANYLEYVYYPDKLTGERQREIVEGLNKFLQTGDYMQLPAPDRVNRSGKFDVLIDGRETSPTAKHQAANDLARQMHVEGEVEVVTSTEGLTGRQTKAKGWYDVRTGKVTIVLPNNKNAADVRETVFHEVVAHKGLRNLVGEENFNTFLDNVYNNAEEGIKQTIDEMAEKKYNGDKRKATEEYMAHLAEDGEYVKPENQGFFAKVRDFLTDLLRKVGIKLGFKLTDNDLRYILWRSWKGLAERDGGSVFEKAEDVKMQHELGQTDEARSASGENGIMFREGSDELKDVVEKMKADVERLHEGELNDLRSGARAIGGRLSELNKAMRLQRAYDMSTVASVTELAKTMLKNGLLSEMSDYDVRRLLSVVNNVHGKGDIRPYVQKVVDMMVGNRLRNVSKAFDKLLAMRGKKVDARGVEVQGELDLAGQRMADVVWKGIGMSDDDVADMCADAQDRMMSANGAEAAAAATDYAGWQIVMRYNETIRDSKSEEVRLREDLKRAKEDYDAGRMTREAYMEFRESTNDAIRENRIERAEAYEELYEQLGGAYGESIKRAADFKAAEKARVLEIQHNANSDMEGRPARSYRKDTAVDKVLNSSPVQLLFAPLGTFDQMLRMFGSKNVKGEGYLWNRYMRGWLTATENEYTGYRDATAELDAKAAEVLGKGKTWADLFALERKLPKATVRVWDDGEMRELELPQGNLLYIYMVNKMADGRMKLRKMGVTEDDVAAIENFLDPRLKKIGDWLQEVYLVEKRGKYNEVHERAYGAAMASIDNYFPLKILKDARAENVDVGVERRESDMLSTITGSVIKRKRNALALDLLNSDAFSVVLDHLQKMEHWSAFAEWNREMNTLLSYKRFRNQVKNMRSAYGSGERLWEAFDKVACIAAGTYDPPKALADKLAVNIAKGVTAAKIILRVFTAFKQFTSFPAYLSDSNPVYLLKGVATPYGSWKWCMENLPLFEKRWKSRMAGDPRLLKNEMDWSLWRDNVAQMAAKWGMTPNAFVDALTVCIGARAMYETRRRKYIRYGYGLEEAERRAKQDASILYNQTQQSSEGAFLSALQVDRSWYSVLFTVFRNSSMSYTRQLYAALRNTGRRIAGGAEFKGISEAFMAKQMERDGIDPDKASKNAKAEYRKSWINDLVRAGVFGYVLQLLWNCSPYAIYMMYGDDEKKFEEIKHDVKTHTAWGFLEGLTGGDVWSAGLQSLWNHYMNGEDFNANSVNKDMPLTSDLLKVVKEVGSDNYGAVNDVLNLLVQAGFGVNPQTLTDAAVAIYDYCGSDVETTKECALLVMRVMNCPQSQMDNIYFDEIDATGEEAKAMSVEEIAERYARYKALRSAPLRALSSDALKAAEKKPRERVLTEAKEQLDGRLMTEEAQRYLDEYEATKKKVAETRALADTDPKAFMQQMPALARSGEFRRYRRVGLYKSEVDKLTKKLLRTSDPAERRALFGKMLDARDKMLKQVREME
jgi:site-specific DNA-cytosine methylase